MPHPGIHLSFYFEDQRANQTGFTGVGTNASGDDGKMWWNTGIADIDLTGTGLSANDYLRIQLFVKDCAEGGHGGLVFLDGFGTENHGDVPEPATLLLFGLGLLGLAGINRKRQ